MRENVVREFIEMSTAYAKDTAHVRSISLGPSEADAPLVVDANAHLPCPIPFQR